MEAAELTCASCGHGNRAGRRFCSHCGAALPTACTACGSPLEPDDRFCGVCGTAVAGPQTAAGLEPTPRSTSTPIASEIPPTHPSVAPAPVAAPRSEERRLVTALFCDLVGFTPLSESLDPEEVRDLQAAYFGRMAEQVERYGGTVEKYAGDAVLALFGAPVAHEDDAERAVLCALGMQEVIEPVALQASERWQVEPTIRIGVNTGEVVSGTWSASGHQDVAVTGDAVNTAARLQSVAEPGEVLVGAETMRLTRRRIRYGDRRDVALKGKIGTVAIWRALGVREEFGERWEVYASPLVGRDRELVQLLDSWVRVQGGEGQLVTVVAEAGVGKSRLISEFIDKLSSGASLRIARARCLSYGQEISYWLLADLLRSLFGVRERETLDEVEVKLRAALSNLMGSSNPDDRAEAMDVLGEVLGLAPSTSPISGANPQLRRQALMRTLRTILGAVTERAPTVLVLEDLHWIDSASEDVLSDILADTPGLRMLIVAAQRPGWTPPWSDWSWPDRVTLRPLPDTDAAVLAVAVLGGVKLDPELERYLAERAGGNPFFVEEILRALQETGGLEDRDGVMVLVPQAAERLPSTLTEVLLARLDRLESQVRTLVQVGSVIGRNFAVQLLAEVVGREQAALELPLSQLQRAEIAFPRRTPELEYVFKHVSMQEVAYNTLVQKRRQELHLQTARAIAALYPSDEYVEMLAYHYSKTNAPEAEEWLERAGDRAASIYANDAALGHYEDALARATDALTMARLNEKLGNVMYMAGRYADSLVPLRRSLDTYQELRDLESAGRVTARMGMAHRLSGTPTEGLELVRPMIDLLEWSGPSEALVRLHIAMANLQFLLGRYGEMLTHAEKGGELARAIGDSGLIGEAEERRGTALTKLGSNEDALRVLEGSIPLVESGGDLVALFRCFNNAASTANTLGRVELSRRYLERGSVVLERAGNLSETAFMLGNLGEALIVLGEWEEARIQLERAEVMARGKQTVDLALPLLELGRLALYEGRWEEARARLEEALNLGREAGDRQGTEICSVVLGELALRTRDAQAAVELLEPLHAADGAEPDVDVTLAEAHLAAGDENAPTRSRRRRRPGCVRARRRLL